jgi:serine/threonine protein kinase/tetratricopeptide (TPR) repeat protein
LTARRQGADDQRTPSLAAQPPTRAVGDYRLLQKIGEGGMGEVWEAEQRKPVRRRVALKLIKWGMDSSEVIARFESERQALALMDHPTIAKVLDAGATGEGRPFFAMEFVKGVPITQYADTERLTTRQRLELMVQVCQGIQHAHQKGVIHRDIKPSNVLVTIQDGEPVPKIIDFGVAKATAQRLTERTVFTELGQWIGTPDYMSPEQAEMSGLDIDTRTDVYSLGVLQYELLTGGLPFKPSELREAGFDEMRRRIREQEPTRPSTKVSGLGAESQFLARNRRTDLSGLARELNGDLDWITMMALDKDRTRRYGSPSELAADIERHLRDEPVLASPPSAVYQLQKFVRRHRVAVAAAVLVFVALVLGTTAATVGLLRAKKEERTARQVSEFLVSMFNDLGPGGSRRGVSKPQELLRRGVERVEVDLAGEPQVQAQLWTAMGSTYRGLGMSESARELLERAVAVQREQLGAQGADYAMTISVLGELLTQFGDYEEARRLHEEALEIRREALGDTDISVAWSLRGLAFTHWRRGEFEMARELYGQALEISRSKGRTGRLDTATTLRLQALLEQEAGEYETARSLFRQALADLEEILGPSHSDVGLCLTDYSLLLQRIGDYDESLASSQRASEILAGVFGSDHPSLAAPLNLNAIVRLDTGDIEGARSRLERALAILEASPEEEQALLGWVVHELGRVAMLAGEREEARSLFERSLALHEQAYGTDHLNLAFSLSDLGEVLALGGDRKAALPLFERALAIRERDLGPDHPQLAWILRPWAGLLRRGGDYEGARRLLDRAMTITERAFGPEHLEVARTFNSLSFLEYTLGDFEEARRLAERELEIRQTIFGAEHSRLTTPLYNIGCLWALTGEAALALEHLGRAVDLGYASNTIFTDPDLDSLRGHPGFEALVARVRSRLPDTTR